MVWVEDNICTYRYGEILHASAVLLKLFMSDRDYMSTGEDLHFLFRVKSMSANQKKKDKRSAGSRRPEQYR